MKFEFTDKEKTTIKHHSGMLFQVLINPVDGEDYDAMEDVYQEFDFRGNYIVCLMLNPDDFEPEPMPVGYQKIHAINRKAFGWYRSQVYIPEYVKPEGVWEDDKYLLQHGETDGEWVLTDKENQIVFIWEDREFNETQRITPLDQFKAEDITSIPTMMRKAGEWLAENHSNKI